MDISTGQLFSISNNQEFEQCALQVFGYQAKHCAVYRDFIHYLNIKPENVKRIEQIPFLPISFFKSHEVIAEGQKATITFSSSGTTGMVQSKHLVSDVGIYEESYRQAYQHFYGSLEDQCILALLPSYLERDGSSLIYMIDDLLKMSKDPDSGYFLHNHEHLYNTLIKKQQSGKQTVLIGVTYALLDLIEKYTINFPELIVMETGGMKGKRKEIVRQELHELLCNGFGVKAIHSEYGMTELLSQAYSKGEGIFACPAWMRILIRDTNDPLSLLNTGKTGGINVIDLANINSCSFIATQDLGKCYEDGSFEVLGRFDNADIRGCNLMVE